VVAESGIVSRFEALRSAITPLVGRDEELDGPCAFDRAADVRRTLINHAEHLMNNAGHAGHAGKQLDLLTEIRGNFPQLPRIHAGQLADYAPHPIQSYQWVARMTRMPRMS